MKKIRAKSSIMKSTDSGFFCFDTIQNTNNDQYTQDETEPELDAADERSKQVNFIKWKDSDLNIQRESKYPTK